MCVLLKTLDLQFQLDKVNEITNSSVLLYSKLLAIVHLNGAC